MINRRSLARFETVEGIHKYLYGVLPRSYWKTRKKWANNTYIHRKINGGSYGIEQFYFVVQYHKEEIAEVHHDRVILHAKGWRTYTTKQRMNWFLPHATIFQSKGVWYLSSYKDGDIRTIPYFDDMEYPKCLNDNESTHKANQEERRIIDLQKKINAYAKSAIEKIKNKNISLKHTIGDCYECLTRGLMVDYANTEHLLIHLEECKPEITLIANAYQEYWGDDITGSRSNAVDDMVSISKGEAKNRHREETLKRSIRRYFRSRLSIGR